jgi:protein TonB
MFESVKQSEGSGGMAYLASLLVSMTVHAVLICMLVVAPLVFFNVLQAEELLTFLVEPPPPPAQPPPPAPVRSAGTTGGIVRTDLPDFPDRIPEGIPPFDDADAAPFDPAGLPALIPGTGGSGKTGGLGKDIAEILRESMVVEEPRRPVEKKPPIRVGFLEQSKLIYRVNPVYPTLAVKARVAGTVILEAVVDEEGGITTLKVLKGHPLLVDAAVEAVRQWKYSPTILNGEPVPVIATVTVVFRLD